MVLGAGVCPFEEHMLYFCCLSNPPRRRGRGGGRVGGEKDEEVSNMARPPKHPIKHAPQGDKWNSRSSRACILLAALLPCNSSGDYSSILSPPCLSYGVFFCCFFTTLFVDTPILWLVLVLLLLFFPFYSSDRFEAICFALRRSQC